MDIYLGYLTRLLCDNSAYLIIDSFMYVYT